MLPLTHPQLPDPEAIASLQLSPQSVVRSFYPLAGNEQAMGHNLLKGAARQLPWQQTACA